MSAASPLGGEDFPFWSFSVALYGRPGVALACLALQDRFGCDVNLILFALWAARCGRALGAAEYDALDAAVAPWRGRMIEPIRELRRAAKADALGAAAGLAEAARQRLLESELAAEKAAQEILVRALPLPEPANAPIAPELAGANLRAYLGRRGSDCDAARRLAGTILAAL